MPSLNVVGLLHFVDESTAYNNLFIRFDTHFWPLVCLLCFSCLLVDEFFKVLHLLCTGHYVFVVLVGCLLIVWVVLKQLHGELVILRDSVFGADLAQRFGF